MSTFLTAILLVLLAPLALGWGAWLIAVIAGARGPQRRTAPEPGVRIALLIPAHDEETSLPALLESLPLACRPATFDPVVVIADHCSDSTAALARASGAEVLERNSGPRGKPAALKDGLALLRERPDHAAVMIVDADCVLQDGVGAGLARGLAAGESVLQCAYRLDGQGRGIAEVSRWAFALKNVVRPRGLARLGAPTQLFGTGMCFRREVIERFGFREHLTEDAALSYELLAAGIEPAFIDDAEVVSPEAPDRAAMTAQRERWEGGQASLLKDLPGHVLSVLRRGNLRSLLSVVDWSAPPLTAGIAAWLGVTGLALVGTLTGIIGSFALWAALGTGVILAAYLILGMTVVGGIGAVPKALIAAPRYVLWKLGVFGRIASNDSDEWRRTPRTESTGTEAGQS